MEKQISKYYRQFRATGGGIVGESAKWAMIHARTLHTFRTLESQGLVRIKAEEEQESYFDVFGTPDTDAEREEMERTLSLYGCWVVFTEYLSPETGEWEHADSIGMCAGYSDPTSPFENCYVPELMRAAIDALVAETEAPELAAAA